MLDPRAQEQVRQIVREELVRMTTMVAEIIKVTSGALVTAIEKQQTKAAEPSSDAPAVPPQMPPQTDVQEPKAKKKAVSP